MSDPWRPVSEAVVGDVCDLRFRDILGAYEVEEEFFLHDDGRWYRVDPPTIVGPKPTHFRLRYGG